jgi:septal ring-binding cell division protein DamX
MASGGRRGGAGERVLESKHVIGLFMLMLVFSGIFFTLGYVMGRSQYDSQVRAESTSSRTGPGVLSKPETRAKNGSSSDIPSQPDSDWTYYKSAKSNAPVENLRPSAPPSTRPVSAVARAKAGKVGSPVIPSGAYTLQVAALRAAPDALALAEHLKRKNFPAFVAAPQGDKYYRVQVGPYPDQKSAENARKGLEGAGFKAIVKH